MKINLVPHGFVKAAILIPTKGRAAQLGRLLQKRPWMNDPSVFIGVEEIEEPAYRTVMRDNSKVSWVTYNNPTESIGLARNILRRTAVSSSVSGGYDYFIATDDNAVYTEEAIVNLVRCAAEFPVQPAISVGYHGFMKFTNRGKKLTDERTVNGVSSYEHVGTILMCLPRKLYVQYAYPADVPALEDRHLVMWALTNGYTTWRICMDAPFAKTRYAEGGSGSVEKRQIKCGLGMARCAADFPQMMGISGVYRAPWKELLALARGKNFATRPSMGSSKGVVAMVAKPKIKVKRKA